MRKTIIILLLIYAGITCKPQISIYGSYNSVFSNYGTFNTFVDSYNAYQTDMTSKCPHSGLMGGYNAGISFSAMAFLCDINYNQIFCSRSAKFPDGGSRRLDLKFNYIVTGIGLGKQFKNIGIWAVGYLNFGDIYLHSYYEYKDESKDIGLSRQLNGCYVGMVAMKFMYGIKSAITISKNINLLIYAGYMARNNLSWKDDAANISLQDLNNGKILDGVMDEIPTDYAKYWEVGGTSYAYRTYTNKWDSTVGCDLGGFNVSIGIKWDIPGTKIE